MKMLIAAAVAALLMSGVCSVGAAMDYADMSNEELAELRGAVRNAPEQERRAYEVEWAKRLTLMSEGEKQRYSGEADSDGARDKEMPQPHIQGRGYDRGMGSVIQGSR